MEARNVSSTGGSAYKRLQRRSIVVTRPIFSQDKFDSSQEFGEYGVPTTPSGKLKRSIQHSLHKIEHWQPNVLRLFRRFLVTVFPILKWIPEYKVRQYLLKDCVAGFTVGVMNIPQGMAYALLAALPAVFGLYTSFFPVLIYTIMCTSRHVSVGVFAVISIMSGKVVNRYAMAAVDSELVRAIVGNVSEVQTVAVDNAGDAHLNLDLRITVIVALTVSVGIWQVVMGMLGLGYLTVYLSDQLVKGFTTGAAFHVFTSQLRPIFGLQKLKEYSGPLKLVYTYVDFFKLIKYTHVPTILVSLICLTFLIASKYLINDNRWLQSKLPVKIPFPSDLLVVIFGALASYMMSLGSVYGVDVVGAIPLGMPQPKIPDLSILPSFLLDSFAIAIVSFAITLSLAKLFANKNKYHIDANQELRALGFSNVFGAFFQCIPSTGSLARTAVQTSVGGETQIVSVISAIFILVVLLALGHLLEPLPKACLGAIIMVALIGLLRQISEVPKLWKISAVDTSVFVISLVAVVLLDVDMGLGVAVAWSLLTVVFRTQRPDVSVLGRALDTDIYRRIDVYKSAAEIPGCKIIRFDSPLYYANAEYFLSKTEEFTKLSKNRHRAIFAPEDRTRKHSSNSYASETGVVNPGLTPEDNEVFEMSTRTNAAPSSRIVFNPARTVGAPSTVDAATLTIDAQQVPLSHVIIDCSSMCFVDVNGLGAIKQLAARCNEEGVVLFLACCKANMREALALSGFIEELHADHLFVTIHDAVMDVLRWEEDGESGLSSGTSLHGQDDQDLDDEAFSRTSIQHGRRRSSAFFTKPTISNKREAPARSESVPDGKTVRMQENRGTDP